METVIESLKKAVGPEGWVLPADGPEFLRDIGGAGGDCLLILRPGNTHEVSQIATLCSKADIAIIPQGGNTNVCRMAVPTEKAPAVLLSLSRMNQILSLNADSATVTVEAGCIMQRLQEVAAEANLLFAPDWGARGTATVGGAVSTNGGGLNVLRYGTTREQVLGMEVVLPDGRVWNGLRALVKDNSGFDLKQLFIGSEGTIGIITKLVFRLHPLPQNSRSMMVALADLPRLSAFFDLGRKVAGDTLSAFELMPGIGVEKALARYPSLQRPLASKSKWYVLVRMSDRTDVGDRLIALYQAAEAEGLIEDAVLANSGAQEGNLWELREQMIPHQYFGDRTMLKWDVSLPTDRIAAFLMEAEQRVHALCPAAICYAVSHVGDGNVHYSAFVTPDEADRHTREEILDTIDALIWSHGGSVVAEHGVGALFRARVKRQKSRVEYDLLTLVKQTFDPHGIMNPGKMLLKQETRKD